MDVRAMIKLINQQKQHERELVRNTNAADRYYRKQNDILRLKRRPEEGNPIRQADNRVASNFYSILVNQKASYMFAKPPQFDVDNTTLNSEIVQILGDGYAKACKDLCINASNASIAWLHCWVDENDFRYGVIDARQVKPIWGSDLENELLAVLRIYDITDVDDGKTWNVYEYWDDRCCYSFRKKRSEALMRLQPYRQYKTSSSELIDYDESNQYPHNFGVVPFIPFPNNNIAENDLGSVKELIDCYDKVYSGFMDDLEDIQEVIFVLSGYDGEDLKEFLGKLKKYKTIKTETDVDGKGGVNTLTIEIPVEAREKMLTMTRKAIFEQGQGIDPDPQNFGNSSGVALRYLYSLLELKSGLMETEFRLGFGKLIRTICKHLGTSVNKVDQIWTRTSVRNDTELASIAQQSMGVISEKTIVKNHPWVVDAEKELGQMEDEREQGDGYEGAFSKEGAVDDERAGTDQSKT